MAYGGGEDMYHVNREKGKKLAAVFGNHSFFFKYLLLHWFWFSLCPLSLRLYHMMWISCTFKLITIPSAAN